MVSVNEGPSTDAAIAAADLAKLRELFWMALGVDVDSETAFKCAEAINKLIPKVEQLDVTEDETDAGPGEGRCFKIEPGSQSVVLNKWNDSSKTSLKIISAGVFCFCSYPPLEKEGREGQGSTRDFRACTTPDCVELSHRDIKDGGSADRVRLVLQGDKIDEGVFAIVAPVPNDAKRTSVFSRPLFYTGDLPNLPEGVVDTRVEMLEKLNLKARALKYLLEGYPGKTALTEIMARASNEGTASGPPVASSPVYHTPRAGGAEQHPQPMAEVTTSPGLQGVVLNPPLDSRPTARHSDTDNVVYPWSEQHVLADDASSAASSVLSSVGADPTVAELKLKLLTHKKEFIRYKSETAKKDLDLGRTILQLRRDNAAAAVNVASLVTEIQSLKEQIAQQPVHPPASISFPRALTSEEQLAIANQVISIGNLVTQSSLDSLNFVPRNLLDRYVSKDYLTGFNYATKDEILSSAELPEDVATRLQNIERLVTNPVGMLHTLSETVQQLKARKGGDEVVMGGVSFKDSTSTEAWVELLEGESDLVFIDYAFDMIVQLLALGGNLTSTTQVTKAKAEARKAEYRSVQESTTTASFSLPYPETIFRPSASAEDAQRGGLRFVAALSSCDTFVGNLEYSTLNNFKKKLENNHLRNQRSIDNRFPRSQAKHARTNAVLTALNRNGYLQAIGFFESLDPFSKMMTDAGLGVDEAWGKCLTYARAVFLRVHEVRTAETHLTAGSMLYGMMKASNLLSAYGELGWIRHPDVSSALVVAALQKEGKAVAAAIAKATKPNPQIALNKTAIGNLQNELKSLKSKNPSWNT